MLTSMLVMLLLTGQHGVDMTWTPSPDCPSGSACTYNIKRVTGPCATPLQTLTVIGTTANAPAYSDPNAPGVYCYGVSASLNGAESPTIASTVQIPLAGITNLVITGK